MLIEEIIRTCAVRPVAEAAVASVGGGFADEVRRAATTRGMSVGDYAAGAVTRFARNGREGEMRAVALAMTGSQEPVLAALERILGLGLDLDETPGSPVTSPVSVARLPQSDARRERRV